MIFDLDLCPPLHGVSGPVQVLDLGRKRREIGWPSDFLPVFHHPYRAGGREHKPGNEKAVLAPRQLGGCYGNRNREVV